VTYAPTPLGVVDTQFERVRSFETNFIFLSLEIFKTGSYRLDLTTTIFLLKSIIMYWPSYPIVEVIQSPLGQLLFSSKGLEHKFQN
jgi:hypothetical protein